MLLLKNLRFCGNPVSLEELDLIVETVKDCSGLSRTELANTVCELLNWCRPNGRLKGHECRQFLEELHEKGVLSLPDIQSPGRQKKVIPKKDPAELNLAPEPIETTLRASGPLELQLVETPEDRKLWRDWVSAYHYLGCTVPFGAHLRYFVNITRPRPQRVGCIQVSSPAWRMACRDRWIGWDDAQRALKLQWIVQNSRFMLVPWVQIPHLASAALARMAKVIPNDWESHYAIRPVLMETLVDGSRFQGTCYRAANWIHVGQTTGRGRMDRKRDRRGAEIKEVWLYPLHRKAREKLLEPS